MAPQGDPGVSDRTPSMIFAISQRDASLAPADLVALNVPGLNIRPVNSASVATVWESLVLRDSARPPGATPHPLFPPPGLSGEGGAARLRAALPREPVLFVGHFAPRGIGALLFAEAGSFVSAGAATLQSPRQRTCS